MLQPSQSLLLSLKLLYIFISFAIFKIILSHWLDNLIIITQAKTMNSSMIHVMKGPHFPFGALSDSSVDSKKILVKKRVNYKNEDEYLRIMEKVEKLKLISHKNTINLRSAEDNGKGFVDLYYPYVAIPIEESFLENPGQTVKELHKQFIELAIYLAKQYILTSFNPSRCGVIINDKKSLIKYYLPLNDITFTDNISTLERSVHLFNLQSMHYLDTLSRNALNSTVQNSSQPSAQGQSHIFGEKRKLRKDSQPVMLQFNSARRLSAVSPFTRQMRKLSHLSKEITQFSQMRKKKTKESTRISAGSFSTMRNLMKHDSTRDLHFRGYMSQTKLIKQRVLKLNQRSVAAIKDFKQLKDLIKQHRSVSILIKRIRQ